MKLRKFENKSAGRLLGCPGWALFLAVFVLMPRCLFSQDRNVNFKIDFSQFRSQGAEVYVEIYYSFERSGLNYQPVKDGYQAGGLIQTFIKKGSKAMMVDSLVIADFAKSKLEILPTQKFTEQSGIRLQPGNYELVSRFTDLVSKKSLMVSDSLKIHAFSADQLKLSGIQLANSIQKQPQAEIKFDKNGLRIIPNASKTYGTGLEQLSFYAEAYHMKFEPAAVPATFHANYFIIDRNGKTVKEILGRPRNKPGTSAIINGSLDVSDLPSGFYSFKIVLIDDFNGQTTEAAKEFQIFRPGDFVNREVGKELPAAGSEVTEFLTMSENELNEYFEKIKYIALKDEQHLFKKLDANGRREFLKNFWTNRDPNPATSNNEKKEEYFRLLEYANTHFSVGPKPGWKTDQGRVLLVYGKPDEIERFTADSDTKAYQIWHYYAIEGGVFFVFVDLMAIRDFRLVHSTHRNEVQELEWQSRFLKY